MAIIQYQINGKTIDMSQVASAIDQGDLMDAMAELEIALSPVVSNETIIIALSQRIMNTGALPTEKEIEDATKGKIKARTNEVSSKFPRPERNLPKCPTCGSTNVEKINAITRGAALGMFGLFSTTARSQFVCQNCSYKW